MKASLIIFILVLCFTCWLADSGAPPNPEPMGIKEVSEMPFGANHEENIIPNFVFTDTARNSPFISKIEDTSNGHDAEFPMGLR